MPFWIISWKNNFSQYSIFFWAPPIYCRVFSPSFLIASPVFFKFNFPLPVPSRSYSYCSLIYPHILFLSLCHSFSARSWWLVVPSLQMAHSDHLLMTGEQRKAFPAAAAWHPIHCASAHAHTHTRTQRLKYLNNDSDPYMHAVIGFKPYRTQTFFSFFPLPSFCSVTHFCIAAV